MEALTTGRDGYTRCAWPGEHADCLRYHDEEWGRPVVEDRRLFEKVVLEGFQSGLSWLTILRKRDAFRRAFREFDFRAVARMNRRSVDALLRDPGIVRHRGKIESALNNARRACELADELGSLASYFLGFEPPRRAPSNPLPASTPASEALSRDLKRRGWTYVGPTTAYAFMQATGIVNDHLPGCAVRDEAEAARAAVSIRAY